MRVVDFREVLARYGQESISGVTFSAESGCVTALLGSTGSGPGLAASVAAGLVRVKSGYARVLGQQPFNSYTVSLNCSYASSRSKLPGRLYLDDYLLHQARLYGFTPDEARQALRLLGLWEVRHSRISKLGRSASEKAKLLTVFCRRAELAIIDGLDGAMDPDDAAFAFTRLLDAARDDGTSILLASSNSSFAREYSDRIVHFRDGSVTGSIDAASKDGRARAILRVRVTDVIRASALPGVLGVEGNCILVRLPAHGTASLLSKLERMGIDVVSMVTEMREEGNG